MEFSFAFTGKGYVILASDQIASRSILKMADNEDKIKSLGSHLAMAYSGQAGDTVQFAEYVERNLRLQQMRNNHPLRPQAAASWVRRAIADSLRSRSPYSVNILLGGYDMANSEAKLYWMDYLGTQVDVPYAAHGGGSYFTLSLLDRYHNPQATLEEGIEVAKRCIKEVQNRVVVSFPKFKVKVVDESGVREIELDMTV